ncbi:MAG: DUF2513 domain-containing protein [Candidatus Kapabacteria bacterium]|nr:DUF2513 domain-containing protein [Candidatus Kapabacteria bacterium]
MKRDMELIRNILLAIEAHPKANAKRDEIYNSLNPELQGFEFQNDTIYEHIKLLKEANIIDYDLVEYLGGKYDMPNGIRITWDGHEYLASIKNDAVWSNIKARLGKESINAPVEIIKQLGISLLQNAFGLS